MTYPERSLDPEDPIYHREITLEGIDRQSERDDELYEIAEQEKLDKERERAREAEQEGSRGDE